MVSFSKRFLKKFTGWPAVAGIGISVSSSAERSHSFKKGTVDRPILCHMADPAYKIERNDGVRS